MDPSILSGGIHAIYGCLVKQDAGTNALDVLRDQMGAEHALLMRMASSGISRLATCPGHAFGLSD